MSKRMLAIAAVLVVMVGCSDSGGSLEAILDPGGETYGHTTFNAGPDKSFGFFVCSRGGAVELESIEPMHTEGDIELLGALVYTSDDRFVGAAEGYPPDGLDETKTEPIEGAIIDSPCDGGSEDEKVQILVGAERTADGGGVIDGFLVLTDSGELEVPLTVLLCGDEMQYCEVLIPEASS